MPRDDIAPVYPVDDKYPRTLSAEHVEREIHMRYCQRHRGELQYVLRTAITVFIDDGDDKDDLDIEDNEHPLYNVGVPTKIQQHVTKLSL